MYFVNRHGMRRTAVSGLDRRRRDDLTQLRIAGHTGMIQLNDDRDPRCMDSLRNAFLTLHLLIVVQAHVPAAETSARNDCRCFHTDQRASMLRALLIVLHQHIRSHAGIVCEIKLYRRSHGYAVLQCQFSDFDR